MGISLKEFEHHNLCLRDGSLQVRDAFVEISELALYLATISNGEFIGGFTVDQAGTDAKLHYIFARNGLTKETRLGVFNEQFALQHETNLGSISDKEPVITHAVSNQQLHINSPSFSKPFWGYVGGAVIPMQKVESETPEDTPAIEPPNGLCCAFGDRIPVAQGNLVYFNDPDFQIKTYVGDNAFPIPGGGKVFNMFQGTEGNLFLQCTNGTYVFTRDALFGQIVYGSLSKICGYEASNYRCGVPIGNTIFSPGTSEITVIEGSNITGVETVKYSTKRYLTEYVGSDGNFKDGKMFATEDGWIYNIEGKIFSYNKANQHLTWDYQNNGTDINVVGILSNKNSPDVWLTKTKGLIKYGNIENNSYVSGSACISLPTEPNQSPVVRYITTTSDNVAMTQQVALRGSVKSKTTPKAGNQTNIVGGLNWDGGNYSARETRSRQHQFAVRTDAIDFEVTVVGSGAKIEVVSVETKGQGIKRS